MVLVSRSEIFLELVQAARSAGDTSLVRILRNMRIDTEKVAVSGPVQEVLIDLDDGWMFVLHVSKIQHISVRWSSCEAANVVLL